MTSWVLDNDFISPAEMTGVIRTALHDLQINRFQLSRWLPNVTLDDINYEYLKGGEGLADAAMYRSYDAESPVGSREGIGKVMGTLPPISEVIPLNEYDRLRLRRMTNADLLPFLARDAQRLARNIAARIEVARGDALTNGSVTINENGVQQVVSFGRAAGHTVTASILWSDHTNAVPLDDIDSWVQTYTDTNGEAPGSAVMSKAAFRNLIRNKQMIGQAYPVSTPGNITHIDGTLVRQMLADVGLANVEIYDAQVKVNGSATRIVAANKFLLLPAPGSAGGTGPTDLGMTVLGLTNEAQDAEYQIPESDQPGITAAVFKGRNPARLYTHAVAIALPVLRNPDLSFAASVA
jgi:hypothetical protein